MSQEYLDELIARSQHAWKAQRAILDAAAAEGRAVTAEEREQVEKTDQAMDDAQSEIERVQRRMKLAADVESLRATTAPKVEEAREQRRDPSEGELLRQLFKGEIRDFTSGLRSTLSDTEYRNAYGETRALATSTDTIDQSFIDVVTVYARTMTPMLTPGIVTVYNTPRGENLTIPRLTADPNHGGTVTAEAGAINQLDPTLSSVTLGAFGYKIITLWSSELDTDNVINLDDIVARSVARELVLDIGVHLTTGTDTTQPNGIITAAANGGTALGTAATANAFDTFVAWTDLIDLKYGMATEYQQFGSWLTSVTGQSKMRKFRDANGNPLWNASLQAGIPPTFDGNPVYVNPAMAAVASATKSFAFGDLSRYAVRRVTPVRVDVDSSFKFGNDQMALRVVERVDGDLIDTAAVAYLVSANT